LQSKSKTPKIKKKNNYSKFRKLKERLQLKSVPTPTEEEVLNEKPLHSVPPLEGVVPLATVAPPKEDGDEGDTARCASAGDVNNDAEKKSKKEFAEKKPKKFYAEKKPMKQCAEKKPKKMYAEKKPEECAEKKEKVLLISHIFLVCVFW
jgi:hypothetical protein